MAVKRSGLGRGLDALFPDKSVEKKPVSPSQNKEESLMENKSSLKVRVQKLGTALSNMVMPNIGAFIAWGIMATLFIDTG